MCVFVHAPADIRSHGQYIYMCVCVGVGHSSPA